MKRKIISIILCATVIMVLTACGSSEEETEAPQEETEAATELTLEAALQEYMDKGNNLNRGDLAAHLEMDYPEDEVQEAIDNADIDWQSLALNDANRYISGPIEYNEDDIRDQLEDEEFTPDEIDYALANADWSLQSEGAD